jgi:hypothetical protein
MSVAVDPSSTYYAWKHYHPNLSEDPQAVWGAAWREGGRAAIKDSGRLVELVPLLRDLLDALEDGRVEADVRATDRRPRPVWDDDDECEVSW